MCLNIHIVRIVPWPMGILNSAAVEFPRRQVIFGRRNYKSIIINYHLQWPRWGGKSGNQSATKNLPCVDCLHSACSNQPASARQLQMHNSFPMLQCCKLLTRRSIVQRDLAGTQTNCKNHLAVADGRCLTLTELNTCQSIIPLVLRKAHHGKPFHSLASIVNCGFLRAERYNERVNGRG